MGKLSLLLNEGCRWDRKVDNSLNKCSIRHQGCNFEHVTENKNPPKKQWGYAFTYKKKTYRLLARITDPKRKYSSLETQQTRKTMEIIIMDIARRRLRLVVWEFRIRVAGYSMRTSHRVWWDSPLAENDATQEFADMERAVQDPLTPIFSRETVRKVTIASSRLLDEGDDRLIYLLSFRKAANKSAKGRDLLDCLCQLKENW